MLSRSSIRQQKRVSRMPDQQPARKLRAGFAVSRIRAQASQDALGVVQYTTLHFFMLMAASAILPVDVHRGL